jgi:uncharacterized membrane protein YeiH
MDFMMTKNRMAARVALALAAGAALAGCVPVALVGAFVCLVLRLLAIRRGWHLPTAGPSDQAKPPAEK